MKILITGGGCEEPIDNVRSLCNFSTGKTSTAIAEYFVSKGHKVTCLMNNRAVKPQCCTVKTYKSFKDLQNLLEETLAEDFDAVIHAAAVSDYSPATLIIDGKEYDAGSINKISSGKSISITLKQNPKIIDNIKKWSKSKTILFGFKLTDHASVDERKCAVMKVFNGDNNEKNYHPDYVISNDKSEITESIHPCTVYDYNMNIVSNVNNVDELCNCIHDLLKKEVSNDFNC